MLSDRTKNKGGAAFWESSWNSTKSVQFSYFVPEQQLSLKTSDHM
jgi:hypothetical protein